MYCPWDARDVGRLRCIRCETAESGTTQDISLIVYFAHTLETNVQDPGRVQLQIIPEMLAE